MDRMFSVAAFLVMSFLPTWAAGAEDEPAFGRTIDLLVDGHARPIGFSLESAAGNEDMFLCNAGVDTPGKVCLGTVQVGALFLTRSRAVADPTSKIFGQSDSRLLIDSGDLAPPAAVGPDVTLLARLSESFCAEIRYFGLSGWKASQVASDPLGTGVRFEGFGASVAAESERLDYFSRLYNIEVNLLPQVTEGIPLVIGFRSLQWHERFEIRQLDVSPASVGLQSHTNNYLYGFQIGAEPYLGGVGGPLRLDGLLKAGVYGNHAIQGSSAALLGTDVEARRNTAAFVGEVGVAIVYRLNRFFAVRGGYEMLWISRIAMAPDQSSTTDLVAPSARLDLGTAFLHGATACVEFAF